MFNMLSETVKLVHSHPRQLPEISFLKGNLILRVFNLRNLTLQFSKNGSLLDEWKNMCTGLYYPDYNPAM